ncbi:LOW QUALITY PROTEIN: carbohydrate sulfotransferase 2-like [Cyprinus carpio]|uniref:Sulfotransferase n=1 Tax=Cyprinus carpio TaxID=7962 RepID=A0A9Q9VZ41_CYPCA|nr:LOW QUALITY PROTEIN: carbohydrate sulfotransferase 2-like [Cyprinus carpio]
MKNKPYPLKFTPPWEKNAGFGRKHKSCTRNHTKIIANPGIVMKVLRRKKIIMFLAYFLLVALTMLNLANYKWTKEPQQCNQPMQGVNFQSRSDIRHLYKAPQVKKRQLVYVLTTWRSGSSFFGELFNQNPDVFFLYEPMWHIWQKLYPGDAVSLQGAARDMLSSLYRCDRGRRDPRAVANSRIKSRHGLIRENLQVVRSRDPKLRRVPFVDPSHKMNKKDGSDYHSIGAMEVICEQMSRTLKTALHPPTWFKGKYMTVRYEDLVENLIKTVRNVYRFVNLSANQDIEIFAMNMTTGPNASTKPFIVSSRNATLAASAWRTVLNYQQIRQVEEYCQHAMSLLGYLRARTAGEAKDLSRPLLTVPKI